MEPLRHIHEMCRTKTCSECAYYDVCTDLSAMGIKVISLSEEVIKILSKYYDIMELNGVKKLHRKKVK